MRSNLNGAVGFMTDYRRCNMLLTRARQATILVGNADTFYNCTDPWNVWFDLMEHLIARDCVCSENFQPTNLELKHEWKGGTPHQKSRGRRRARDKSDAGNKAQRRTCVLSDKDITELTTVYDFCRERIVENQNFNVIFHELMSRPHTWTFNISDRFNLPLEVRDRKYSSYYGRTSNPGFGDDEGNVYLRLVFVGLCRFLKCLPVQWTYYFPKGEEHQGDVIEAFSRYC